MRNTILGQEEQYQEPVISTANRQIWNTAGYNKSDSWEIDLKSTLYHRFLYHHY